MSESETQATEAIDADKIKREMFEDWKQENPEGTEADFEKWFAPAAAVFGF